MLLMLLLLLLPPPPPIIQICSWWPRPKSMIFTAALQGGAGNLAEALLFLSHVCFFFIHLFIFVFVDLAEALLSVTLAPWSRYTKSTQTYVYTHTHTRTRTYIFVYAHTRVRTQAAFATRSYTNVCVFMYVCMHACMHVCTRLCP